jgi:hypothetical protein
MIDTRLCQQRLAGGNSDNYREGDWNNQQTKKSGLKVVTLIATLNPVSQVLW